MGDKLIESYFINDLPLFADRLLGLKNENINFTLNHNSQNTKFVSLPIGSIIYKLNSDLIDNRLKFDLNSLNLSKELTDDYLVNSFIKKVLLIPEKDLITMLTNFKNNGRNIVGNNEILKLNNRNFEHIYKSIFGFFVDNNTSVTGSTATPSSPGPGHNAGYMEIAGPGPVNPAYTGITGATGATNPTDTTGPTGANNGDNLYYNPDNIEIAVGGGKKKLYGGDGDRLGHTVSSEPIYGVISTFGTAATTITSNQDIPIFAYSGYDRSNSMSSYEYLAKKYSNVLFIFNDNFKEGYSGTGGNAVIRNRDNAFGIPTGAYQGDNAFVNNNSLYITTPNTITLATKVNREICKDDTSTCPTVQTILDEILNKLKKKIKPDDASGPVFKAVVYSSENNSLNISTDLFTSSNGTNNTIKDYIRDEIIKKVSNYNDDRRSFQFGIKKVGNVDDLNNNLNNLTLFSIPKNNNTVKVIKYQNKYTSVSTRFYQLVMESLLKLLVDRIKYYLDNTIAKNHRNQIDNYLNYIRTQIKSKSDELITYLTEYSGQKINQRSLIKKKLSKFDMKIHNKDFYLLTRYLIKLINEESKITNLVYIINTINKVI